MCGRHWTPPTPTASIDRITGNLRAVLRFYVGRIPVSLHFSFALLLYIAYTYTRDLAEAVLAGVGIFAGILTHEIGHALTARRFGAADIRISLFALGGATTFRPPSDITAGRRFLIAASGSALAIVSALPVYLGLEAEVISEVTVRLIATGFVVAGLLWGLLNWIPIRPLDGGQMLTSALQIVMPERGATVAKVISAALTAAAVIWLIANGNTLLAVYVAFIGAVGLTDATDGPRPRRPQTPAEVEGDPPSFPL